MTFEELLDGVKKIKLQEMREHENNYLEIVVSKADLDLINSSLAAYFGVPIKPEGERASPEAAKHSKPYGGIMSNQTMYFQKNGGRREAAMLWPWGNGTSITVKIIRE